MQVNYVELKYIVVKVDYPESYPEDSPFDTFQRYLYCTSVFSDDGSLHVEPGVNLETFKSYNACLRVQEVGEEHSTYLACGEFHSQDAKSGKWSVRFGCSENGFDTFHMRPNGHFHKGYIHGNVQDKPEDDYKDSLTIYVGKCVDITS